MATINSKFNLDNNIIKDERLSKVEKKSKYCSKCGYENLITSKFCAECGNDKFYDTYDEYNDVKNSKYCVGCKTKLSIKTKFCPNCGKNEFVNSLDDIENLELINLKSYWSKKINEKQNNIKKFDYEIKQVKSEIKNIQDEFDFVEEYFNKNVEHLNNHTKSIQASNIDRMNKLELEFDELVKKQEEIKSNLSIFDENCKKEESDLLKKIDDITKKIDGYKSDNAKLESEVNKVKKTNSFQLKKLDKDHVYLGRYDGKEILWNVINETSTEMLLITNECIDAGCKGGTLLHEKADKLLDKIFKEAFNNEEKEYIVGNISLLSHTQLINHMYFKEKRLCGYNKLAGSKANLRNGLISWWLKEDEVVNGKGDINTTVSTSSCHGIRPVITVKKKK